jgi:membrane-bound ClpP family serine protease
MVLQPGATTVLSLDGAGAIKLGTEATVAVICARARERGRNPALIEAARQAAVEGDNGAMGTDRQ